MSEFKALKFGMNEEVTVVLTHDQPRSSYSEKFGKTSYWYGIKELINGENGFNATQKLHETIQGLGLKSNDTAVIKKINNGTITFFTVNENQVVKNDVNTNTTTGGDIMMKDIQPEVPLQARINTLEDDVKKIKEWMNSLANSGGTTSKDNDSDIPF